MRQPSQITDRFSAEWLAGYRAALADLAVAVDSLGADGAAHLLHARLTAELLRRQSNRAA